MTDEAQQAAVIAVISPTLGAFVRTLITDRDFLVEERDRARLAHGVTIATATKALEERDRYRADAERLAAALRPFTEARVVQTDEWEAAREALAAHDAARGGAG